MIFVGNRGCVQIFTGALEKLAPMRGWLNIFNPTGAPSPVTLAAHGDQRGRRGRRSPDGRPAGGKADIIFVGNRGCVQIFTGALEKLAPMRGWLNIFNPTFTWRSTRQARSSLTRRKACWRES
jgi:putative heme degradation protein